MYTASLQHHDMSPAACLALPYIFTLSQKWYDFWKKIIELKMCLLISSTASV